jgi:hypothetical protein
MNLKRLSSNYALRISNEVSTSRVSGWIKEASLIHLLKQVVLTSFLHVIRKRRDYTDRWND